MLQIPANFRLDDGVTGDEDKVVADLREIAVRFSAPSLHGASTNPFRFLGSCRTRVPSHSFRL